MLAEMQKSMASIQQSSHDTLQELTGMKDGITKIQLSLTENQIIAKKALEDFDQTLTMKMETLQKSLSDRNGEMKREVAALQEFREMTSRDISAMNEKISQALLDTQTMQTLITTKLEALEREHKQSIDSLIAQQKVEFQRVIQGQNTIIQGLGLLTAKNDQKWQALSKILQRGGAAVHQNTTTLAALISLSLYAKRLRRPLAAPPF